jgi:RNA polymerase sigma-70 factor (ECF subfamily)
MRAARVAAGNAAQNGPNALIKCGLQRSARRDGSGPEGCAEVLENERDVIIEWKNGSKTAYEKLVRHYMTDAFLIAQGFVGNPDDARDLSQDAFVKAYQARESFDANRPFYPWLYRILKNHCLNFLKRSGRKTASLYFEDNPDRERFSSPTPTPLQNLEREERIAVVRAAIGNLSEDHREIIILKNFKGYSYAEIAQTLDIPIGTVMSRLFYARKALKELIERIELEGLPESKSLLGGSATATGEVF